MKPAFTARLNRIEAALQQEFSGFNKGISPNTPIAFLLDHLQAHPHDIETKNVLQAFDQAVTDIEAFDELPGAQTLDEKLSAAVLQGNEHGQRLACSLIAAFQNVVDRRNELKQRP